MCRHPLIEDFDTFSICRQRCLKIRRSCWQFPSVFLFLQILFRNKFLCTGRYMYPQTECKPAVLQETTPYQYGATQECILAVEAIEISTYLLPFATKLLAAEVARIHFRLPIHFRVVQANEAVRKVSPNSS